MIAVDDYVIDVLMRDLVAHDRRPRQFLAVPVACQGTTASRRSSSGELSRNGRIRWRLQDPHRQLCIGSRDANWLESRRKIRRRFLVTRYSVLGLRAQNA